MIDINDPSNAVIITSLGTMLVITLAHALRNLWKKTLQDSLEINDNKSHGDLVTTLLAERVSHNKDLLDCYDKYNKLVAEYSEILIAVKESRIEIEALRREVSLLKNDLDKQQNQYTKQVNEMSIKLDEALKEKHALYTENTRLKEQLYNVVNSTTQ